jgi:hypothetical protein
MPELSPVHIQRLRAAVEAAKQGAEICFRVCDSQPKKIAWFDPQKSRVQHVICNAYGDAEPWKAAVESKFLEMLICNPII